MVILLKRSNIYMLLLIFALSGLLYIINAGAEMGHRAGTAGSPDAAAGGAKVIVVDAGHGGPDPGASSPYDGKTEKEINLKIASMLSEKLEAAGYKTIMTRTDDSLHFPIGTESILAKRKADLAWRKSIMDGQDVDLAISVHLNKFEDSRYRGAQIFFPPRSPESEQVAKFIQMAIRETVDPANTREALVNNRGIVILKNLVNPTVVAEFGFLSNRDEDVLLGDEAYLAKLAAAVVDGVNAYFSN